MATGAVALAVIGGLAVGLLASGGGEATQPAPPTALPVPIRADEPPTPLGVRRISDLGPSEALLLAAAAQARDRRADAASSRGGDVAAEGTLSLPPISSQDRYRYLRRVAALAVILEDLGERASRIGGAASLEPAIAPLRARLDRLAAAVDGLDLSIYLRSRHLNTLVTTAVARIDEVVGSGSAADVRRLGRRLADVGRSLAGELERAASAAGAGDQERARRLLEAVDRRLGGIEAAV